MAVVNFQPNPVQSFFAVFNLTASLTPRLLGLRSLGEGYNVACLSMTCTYSCGCLTSGGDILRFSSSAVDLAFEWLGPNLFWTRGRRDVVDPLTCFTAVDDEGAYFLVRDADINGVVA